MKLHRARIDLETLLKHVDVAAAVVDRLSLEEFLADAVSSRAVSFTLMQIGEIAARIIRYDPSVEAANPAVPWHKIRGLRNRLVHGYEDVDLEVIYFTAKDSLPLLRQEVERICSSIS